MANRITSPGSVIASDTVVEVLVPLGTAGAYEWWELPGADATSVNDGTRSMNETSTYRGNIVHTGELSLPEITFDISAVMPHHRVIKAIRQMKVDEELLSVRWYTPFKQIRPISSGTNNDCDISTAGVVTFNAGVSVADLLALGSDQIPEGVCLFTGSVGSYRDFTVEQKTIAQNNQITSMNVVDAATDAPPGTALNSEPFGFRFPQVEEPAIVCHIISAGDLEGSSANPTWTSTLQLKGNHKRLPPVVNSNPA